MATIATTTTYGTLVEFDVDGSTVSGSVVNVIKDPFENLWAVIEYKLTSGEVLQTTQPSCNITLQ